MLERQKNNNFSLAIAYKFCDLVHRTVVIGAMLKTGFGKKMHIRGFVNESTI